jgi:hypothetical protein
MCRLFFSKRRSSSDTINKNLTELGPNILLANEQLYLGNQPELDTCSSQIFFLTMSGTITSENIDI